MIYDIDDVITFNDFEHSIRNSDTQDVIFLPATASYILTVLIKSRGKPVSKNEIIDLIWMEFGAQVASNTVNQYISLIRNSLLKLSGKKNYIITVPKIGFMIDIDTVTSEEQTLLSIIRQKMVILSKDRKIIYLLIIVLLNIFILLASHPITTEVPDKIKLGKIESCTIYSYEKTSFKDREALSIAKKTINDYLPCHDGSSYMMDYIYSVSQDEITRIYLSRCNSRVAGRDASCKEVLLYVDN